jgi:hypothetical protein
LLNLSGLNEGARAGIIANALALLTLVSGFQLLDGYRKKPLNPSTIMMSQAVKN